MKETDKISEIRLMGFNETEESFIIKYADFLGMDSLTVAKAVINCNNSPLTVEQLAEQLKKGK